MSKVKKSQKLTSIRGERANIYIKEADQTTPVYFCVLDSLASSYPNWLEPWTILCLWSWEDLPNEDYVIKPFISTQLLYVSENTR